MRVAPAGYLLGERVVRRYLPRAHAAWSGSWLGVLRRGGLHAIDRAMYDARRNYHGAEHNRRGLFPWEAEAVAGHFAGRARVAVLGAGAGREVLALWRMGFAPLGFECNPSLVAAAARFLPGEGCPHAVLQVPRDAAPPASAGRFDAAIVGWSAYSLVSGRSTRVDLLRGIGARLPPGAPLLLSFFTREAGDLRAARVARAAGRVRRALRRPPPEEGDDLLPNFVHRFTRAGLEAELAEAGFRAVRFQPQGPGPYDSGWAVGARD